MSTYYACDDCGTAMHERASLCLECYRARQDVAQERADEWWSE